MFHSPEGKNLNSRGWQPRDRGDKWVTTSEGSNKSVVMCCSTPSGSVSISPFAPWVTPTAIHIQAPSEGVTKFKMSTIDFIDQNAFFLNSPFDLRIDF